MEHRHNFENELDEQDKKKGAINLEIKDLLKWWKRIWGGLPSIIGMRHCMQIIKKLTHPPCTLGALSLQHLAAKDRRRGWETCNTRVDNNPYPGRCCCDLFSLCDKSQKGLNKCLAAYLVELWKKRGGLGAHRRLSEYGIWHSLLCSGPLPHVVCCPSGWWGW